MASLRLKIKDEVLYEGPAIAVPRAGEDIHRGDEIVRIEAVVWNFESTEDVVVVTLVVGGQPYTF